jgi:hypothetical protein
MSLPASRNPLYLLLLLVGLVLVVTALAYVFVPMVEDKAAAAGSPPPPSAFRHALRTNGWRWLLYEVAVLIVVGVASMVVDHLRSLQKPPAEKTIPPEQPPQSSPPG